MYDCVIGRWRIDGWICRKTLAFVLCTYVGNLTEDYVGNLTEDVILGGWLSLAIGILYKKFDRFVLFYFCFDNRVVYFLN